MKQEARFALHVLQHDSKMAGYKHPDSTDGEVQVPVKVLNNGHIISGSQQKWTKATFVKDELSCKIRT